MSNGYTEEEFDKKNKPEPLWISILMLAGVSFFIALVIVALYFTTQNKESYEWTPKN